MTSPLIYYPTWIAHNVEKKKLVIISAVRFFYKNIPAIFADQNKGNDKIIEGLAKYYLHNPNIEIIFFEKGPDTDAAKAYCQDLGLSKVVIWQKQLNLNDLLHLYELADICFDQVGNHWVGAVGMYALYMGKPLIANVTNLSFLGDIPALNVVTSEDVFNALVSLESNILMKELHNKGKNFAEKNLGPNQLLSKLVINK
jgi:glycosyltransferase involved in cell wall biosynthesis